MQRINYNPGRIASTLGYEDFIETYALTGRPVVLKGGVSLCFGEGRVWDREALRKDAGDKVKSSSQRCYMEDLLITVAYRSEEVHFPLTARIHSSSCPPHRALAYVAPEHRPGNGSRCVGAERAGFCACRFTKCERQGTTVSASPSLSTATLHARFVHYR